MSFSAPEWFLLIPCLLLAGWRWPHTRLDEPLRCFCLALLVLILSGFRLRLTDTGLDLWVLVDRSNSAAAARAECIEEWLDILSHAKGADDRMFVIDYADQVVRRENNEGVFPGAGNQTRTALATRYALSQMEEHRNARILLFTDGFHTEPMRGISDVLRRADIPLDYRFYRTKGRIDFRVKELKIPQRVQAGEAFLIDAVLVGNADGEIDYVLLRDGQEALRGKTRIENGEGRLRLTDRRFQSGAFLYTLRIDGQEDASTDNNALSKWIEIAGGPRIVLITSYAGDPLEAMLGMQGFYIDVVSDPSTLTPGRLTNAKVVVINNVPAHSIPLDFLQSLDFFVRSQGGGLL